MVFRIVGWIFVCLLASSGAGLAAGISKRDAQILDKQVFDLSGPIESGDLERLRALAPPDGQSIISFDSNGGDFQAGLALARYLHEKSIGTIVEDGRKCLSACAIAFLGGTALGEESSLLPARSIAPTARLGFHAPFLNVGQGQYGEEQIEGSYDKAVRTIVDVVQTAEVFQVDASDAAELMRPQRQDMTYLDSADELGTYFVAPQGLEMPEHLTPTMVAAMCANGWLWAHNDRMTDVTAFENPDVFANSLKLIAKTGWNGKHATVKMDDGSLRTAVPLTQAREGATMYCAVSQVATEFGKATFCDGFFDADSLKEAVEFVKNGWEMRYPCGVSMVVDPLKGGDDAYFNVSRALVPPSTPLDGMQDRLTELAATEEPLPAPELAK